MTRNHPGGFLEVVPFSLTPSDFSLDLDKYNNADPVTKLQCGIISAHAIFGGYVYTRIFSVDAQNMYWTKLQGAFQRMVDDNPIYRSVFIPSGAGFAQAVNKHFDVPWEFLDHRHEPHFSLEDFARYLAAKLNVAEPVIRVAVFNRSFLPSACTMQYSTFGPRSAARGEPRTAAKSVTPSHGSRTTRVTYLCNDHNEYRICPAWKGIDHSSQDFLKDIGWCWKVLWYDGYHDADATDRKLDHCQRIAYFLCKDAMDDV